MSVAGLSHLDSANARLVIQWNTFEAKSGQRLAPEAALAKLRGDDHRPLLILRDPKKGVTDQTLADRICGSFSNEKVQLASQWFRCIKVGDEVLQRKHPLSALFDGDAPPHVILASNDGDRVVRTLAKRSECLDWQDVVHVLMADYRESPTRAIKELQKVLVKLDDLDDKHKAISWKLREAEQKGAQTTGRKLRKQLKRLKKEFEKTLAREKRYQDLDPRNPPKTDAKKAG